MLRILCLAIVLCVSCKDGTAAPTSNRALNAHEERFNEYFVKCGDFWTTKKDIGGGGARYSIIRYFQLASINVSIEEQELSSADKLNGITYLGRVSYGKDAASRWRDVPGSGSIMRGDSGWIGWFSLSDNTFRIREQEGEWLIVLPGASDSKPTCEEIPQ